MTDKYTVQDVFDNAVAGKPVEFEAAVADVIAGKARSIVDVMRATVKADLFKDPETETVEDESEDETESDVVDDDQEAEPEDETERVEDDETDTEETDED